MRGVSKSPAIEKNMRRGSNWLACKACIRSRVIASTDALVAWTVLKWLPLDRRPNSRERIDSSLSLRRTKPCSVRARAISSRSGSKPGFFSMSKNISSEASRF